MPALPTARLQFRPITEADAEFIFELYNTASFKRFIGDKNFQTLEDARRFIVVSLVAMYRVTGMGLQLVELRSDGTPVGICGLIKRESLAEVDLGFGYLPAYEGLGFGAEAARSFIDLARRELQLPRIVAITTSENVLCIKLLGKLGFRFDRVHEVLSPEIDLGLYVLDLE